MFGFFRKICGWQDEDLKPLRADQSIAFLVKLRSVDVGTLRAAAGKWYFTYTEEYRTQKRYAPIVDFPALDREYESEELWPFFALRIPSTKQPAVQAFIDRHHGCEVNEADLLKEFGSRSIANPFEVVAIVGAMTHGQAVPA